MFISLSELKIDFGLFSEILSHIWYNDERPKNKNKIVLIWQVSTTILTAHAYNAFVFPYSHTFRLCVVFYLHSWWHSCKHVDSETFQLSESDEQINRRRYKKCVCVCVCHLNEGMNKKKTQICTKINVYN